MKIDNHQFNLLVAPISAAMLDVYLIYFLFEQIIKASGTWYIVIDLTNVFFLLFINRENQKHFAFI